MSWKLVIGIEKYVITDQEKDFYLEAIRRGEQHIQIKRGLFVSPNYQSLAELNDNNPILNNPNWIELQELKDKGDDVSVRRKMLLEKSVNTQFPYDRYVNEWEEIKRITTDLVKV